MLQGIEKFAGETSLLTGIARIHEVKYNRMQTGIHYYIIVRILCSSKKGVGLKAYRLSGVFPIPKICEALGISPRH